jgi:hypothetical protein
LQKEFLDVVFYFADSQRNEIFLRQKYQSSRWLVDLRHVMGMANGILFFLFVHSIKFTKHDMQHACAAQLLP